MRVIERDGLHALTTRSVATEAQLPHGAVHYWFADKADLMRGAMQVLLCDVRTAILTDAGIVTFDKKLASVHERLTSLPEGRLLALFELTLYAARVTQSRDLGQEQYEAYTVFTEESLRPIVDVAGEAVPGGTRALATLITAVIDGLTLASLTASDDLDIVAARTLFAHLVTAGATSP